jgi:hypothetical protein
MLTPGPKKHQQRAEIEKIQPRGALRAGLNLLGWVGGTPSIQIESYGYNVNIISI